MTHRKTQIAASAIVAALAALAWVGWQSLRPADPAKGFVSGNGRIEATEVNVATRLAARVDAVLVSEGDFVEAGQPLARMRVQTLEAQLDEARAQLQQAVNNATAAQAQIAVRQSDEAAQQAVVRQRRTEHDAALRRLARSETLQREGATSAQQLDDDRAGVDRTEAAVAAAIAQATAARSAIEAAKAQRVGLRSTVDAVQAMIARIQSDIDDSQLTAPRDGRVQYVVAQPGEVLASGGRVLNLVDLSNVHMSFFVPEAVAGRIALGSEVRIVLDAMPGRAIPARVSFGASTAQFTPKTVETASERQKLMFRVKAQIDRELLRQHLDRVKTGVPGVAWIRLDPAMPWPADLALFTAEDAPGKRPAAEGAPGVAETKAGS